MMKNIIIVLLLLITSNNYSQELLMDMEDVHPADVIEPKYNEGGLDKFYEYINHEFDFTKVTKPGKLLTSFTVNTDGEIKNIRVLKFPNDEAAGEIVRVLNKAQKWQPAKRGGKPFSIEIKIPLEFKKDPKSISVSDFERVIEKSKSPEVDSETENLKTSENITVESKPEFPGGMKAFYDYIAKNFNRPNVKGLQGKIIVSFVIEKDGSATDFKILKEIGYGTAEEAIRVIKNSPKWKPGMQKGQPVRVLYTLPITI